MPAERCELALLVAGHTNTGKTSLLRTLGRTEGFGEVSAMSATTRCLEPLVLLDTGVLRLTAWDSPGMESASALRDRLAAAVPDGRRSARVVEALVRQPDALADLEAECVVLRHALDCDAVIYVIDACEPVLEKYRDELEALQMCGRPLLPLLNFTARPGARTQMWHAALSDLGVHGAVEFDVVVYRWDSERRLYEVLSALLPWADAALRDAIAVRAGDTEWRTERALRVLAEGLIDLAACTAEVPADDRTAIARAIDEVQQWTRRRETELGQQILEAFHYAPEVLGDRLHEDWSPDGWARDAFAASALRDYGLRAAAPGATGAGVGAAVDITLLGSTLGLGTAIGAVAGSATGARGLFRDAYRHMVRRQRAIGVDENVLRLVAARNLELIATLERRGHASQQGIRLAVDRNHPLFRRRLPPPLARARFAPHWSSFADPAATRPQARRPAADLGNAMGRAGRMLDASARERAVVDLGRRLARESAALFPIAG